MKFSALIYKVLYIFLIAGCNDDKNSIIGYIEDEYIYMSSEIPAEIKKLDVSKGDVISTGEILFRVDNYTLNKKKERLEKNKQYEEAILGNMQKGIRQSEIDLINIDVKRISSELSKAESTLERKRKLQNKNFVSKEDIESEELNLIKKRNELQKIKADLNNRMLPARNDELLAQKIKINTIDVDIDDSKYEISKAIIRSPVDGVIHDILKKEGEFASTGNPVLIITPNGYKKVKFYINRSQLYKVKHGEPIIITINDLDKEYEATINFISNKPEYTPPMLYDNKNDTLVYLIEAKFNNNQLRLPAGIPVEVKL